ncbi:uncharacterized protein TNCV_4894011 [Trichonephila clavipes]|nr:uncharacterized protein TNCV_4894011 [Trichonephila clavipes]
MLNNSTNVWCPQYCGRGSLVVKVTDSWNACHDFEPCTTEDPPCRGGRYMLNMSRLKRPLFGVEFRRGGCQLSCRHRHLIMAQNYEVHRQKF